ncbi:MAG: anaerobic C4-dicarboxylate transporter, partial [Bacteroidetes bacterium]|nr:anaerobic C4-dicarboxylate transporter [Bacteroidota bacterium]
GIGLFIFVFIFELPPGSPPKVVLGMIIAVITALATMQAAGGLDYLIMIAGKIMKKRPQDITFIAPFVTYILIFASGTQHVIYALLPVISEISLKAKVRPERPLSISVIAAMSGLIASPISAASVAMVGALASYNVSLPAIMMVIIPTTFIGVLIGTLSVAWKGKNLEEDPVYLERLKEGKISINETTKELKGKELKIARYSTIVFFVSIIAVVIIGLFPQLRPTYQMIVDGAPHFEQVGMGVTIMIIMLAASGLMMIFFNAKPGDAVKGSIMRGGIVAIISILGISWLGSSFFEGNRVEIISGISSVIETYPWIFGLGLFVLSILLFSQAATIVTLMPVGIALGLPVTLLIGFYPAVNGYFFLPTYGTVLAAVSFDQTGTTKIGKYLLNHSFMLPGLVVTITTTLLALLLSNFLL